jgi:short-subunit dehydrogenase
MTTERAWAVVTGASSGLGKAFAAQLASRGYPVMLVARRERELEDVAAEVRRLGGEARVVVADLSSAAGLGAVVGALDQVGPVDVLVNNAGFGEYGPFLEQRPEADAGQVALNIGAVVGLTRALLPRMVARGRGSIINLASALSFMPVPYFATYAATKAFVLHFSEAIAEEVRGSGVQVLAVGPGPASTGFVQASGMHGMRRQLPLLNAEEVVRVSLEAADRGRVVRVIGTIWRLLAFVVRITPRFLLRRIMAGVVQPATVDPHSGFGRGVAVGRAR